MDPLVAVAAATVPVVVGGLVLRARQARIGGLLVAHGVCFGTLFSLPGSSSTRPGLVADQLGAGTWVFLFVWLALIGYLVPDGLVASAFWRRWIALGLAGVVLFLVGSAGDVSGFRQAHGGTAPPVAWLPEPVSGVLGVTGLALTVLLVFGGAVAVVARLRRASGDERLQLLWLVWGAISLPAALLLVWLGHFGFEHDPLIVDGALVLAGVGLPVAIGVAVLRHRLFDVQLVLSRTLTYGVLVVSTVALYALLLLAAERVLGSGTAGGLVAVGAVAVAVHPAHAALRRRIERWVYGYRSDPAAALRRLGDDLDSADPLHLIDAVTASVADALRVELVRVEQPGGERVDLPRATHAPLLHRGEHIGDLVVCAPPGRTFSAEDAALLRDLARHAAVTVRAAQLAEELRASRSRIVTAREEERKRLRRDLHDGIGPSLAAIVLKLRAVQGRRDDAARNALLAEVRAETRSAISEVRRVVDDLRPPAIDEVGLVDAIRQRAASLTTTELVVAVSAPAALPPLSAAVEVAAFRIVTEAMTNAARHSNGSRCVVDVQLNGALGLTVSDNGTAREPAALGGGVGWTSMVERATELGGTCSIGRTPTGGVVVQASLPLHTSHGSECRA